MTRRAGLISLAFTLALARHAPAAQARRKCVVVVLPAGGWGELAPAARTALAALASQGAAGSMSCAVARPMSEAGAWVTLGAGNRALSYRSLADPVADTHLPLERQDAGRVVAHGLQSANEGLPYPIDIGSVAGALHRAGLRTAVVGAKESWQLAPALDGLGRIDVLITSDLWPAAVRRALAAADYVVINGAATPGQSALGALVQGLGRALKPDDLLIAAALAPRQTPFVGLTPIVIRGPGFHGVLTSATTRRLGLIANIDLPPTILTYFSLPLPPSYDNGSLVTAFPAQPFHMAEAIWLDAKTRQAEALRPLALPIFFGAQMLLVPLALLSRKAGQGGWLARTMLALMCLPAASYIAVPLPPGWPHAALVAAMVAAAAAVGILAGAARPAGAVAVVSGLTVALLVVDALTGSRLQPVSLIGYSPGLGGRFYGLGNEVCGLLIAAAALFVGVWMAPPHAPTAETPRAWTRHLGAAAAFVVLAGVTVVNGHPSLGSNAGCVLAGVICFGALWASRVRGHGAWLVGLLVCAAGTVVLLGLAAFDASRGPEQMTHLGRAWLRLTSEGGSYLTEFARRRLSTAWSGLTETPASLIAGTWTLFWTAALVRPVGFVRRACDGLPGSRATLAAIAIGGFAACLLEDSTVAIPAMMLSIALPVLGIARTAGDG